MRERILEAIRTNKRLDFSSGVLRGQKDPRGRLLPPLGPVLNASFQQFPSDKPAYDGDLTTRDIETLSLAARHELLGGEDDQAPEAPVWMRNCASGFVELSAADICAAVSIAVREFSHACSTDDRGHGDIPDPARHGLQIVGARIVGTLDLVNCRAPFSIRLIGCLIDEPLRISHAEFLTIDLSGSAVRGVFATYVRCRSVRMRRLFSTSVVDFGGAQVEGVFDASDCVVVPRDAPPQGEAFVGDRGAFNCSLARIHNEMRLSRARIYGGLSMMGTVIDRSLFLTDAVVRSPVAALETLAYAMHKNAPRHGKSSAILQPNVRAHGEADDHLAALLHVSDLKASEACRRDGVILGRCSSCRSGTTCLAIEYKYRIAIESLVRHLMLLSDINQDGQGRGRPASSVLLKRLLGEYPDARISAWRAQGAEIKGSVYATGMRAGGGLRLKYLTVKGSLQLEGVRLRSPLAVWAGLETMIAALDEGYQRWFRLLRDGNFRIGSDHNISQHELATTPSRSERDQGASVSHLYAVDLRYARVEGDVRFGLNDRRSGMRKEMAELAWLSWAAGDEAARADLELFQHLDRRITASVADRGVAGAIDPMLGIAHEQRSRVIGGIHVGSAHVGGELDLTGVVANMFAVAEGGGSNNPVVPENFLDFSYSTIERGVDLTASIGVKGVCGQYSVLNGPLRFCKMEEREEEPPSRRAMLLGGNIFMVGAKVKGDALFLFDAEAGPTLKLKRSSVGGRLYIVPRSGDMSAEVINFPEIQSLPVADKESDHEIDLRNVTAPVFMHVHKAWPKKGKLQIEGFDYLRARRKGPLSPAEGKGGSRRELVWQSPLMNATEWRSAGFFVTGLVVAVALALFFAGKQFVWLCECFLSIVGFWNLIFVEVWLGFVIAFGFVRQKTKPTPHDAKPRGIAWLSLQRRRPNPHRSSATLVPLQPYLLASRVLNASGQFEAAQRIELERLRERARIWSVRHNPGLKLALAAADLFFKYGFAPMRALSIGFAVVLFGAMAFNSADMCAQIQPTADNVVSAPWFTSETKFDTWRIAPDLNGDVVGYGESAPLPYPKFVSLLYSLDVVVPIFDLGQEQYWVPSYSPMRKSWSGLPHCEVVSDTYFYWIIYTFLKILGWIFATLIAVAVITRAETLVARNEE